MGGLETSLSSLTGQRLPGRLENKVVAEEGNNTLGAGSGKPHQREPGRRAWSAPVLGRGEKKGWVPIEYPPHHSKLTGPLASRKLRFPVHPPRPHHPLCSRWTWGYLPSRRAGLNNCLKPTTAGALPAQACLPFGGATLPQSSTKHHQPPRKGLQPRKARTSLARP